MDLNIFDEFQSFAILILLGVIPFLIGEAKLDVYDQVALDLILEQLGHCF